MNNFITFEGIEGSGKSTQSKLLAESFSMAEIKYIHTREPGGTDQAEKIRQILVSGDPKTLDKITELLLIFAARNEHIKKKIKPALDEGHFVICDRFIDSTIAYQGYGHGIDLNIIANVQNIVLENIEPDLTFIFDMNIEKAFERINQRNDVENRFERMALDFHMKMQKGFTDIYNQNSARCILIDADQNIEIIHQNIIKEINKKFNINLIPNPFSKEI